MEKKLAVFVFVFLGLLPKVELKAGNACILTEFKYPQGVLW